MTRPADGCIIDLDGTLYVGDREVPGAPAAVAALRSAGIPVCFATNTTRRPRSALVVRLAEMGFDISADELHTAPVAAARWLEQKGARRVSLLLPEATFEDFARFDRDDREPDHVVVDGLPVTRIAEVARKIDAGHIVVGGKERSKLSKIFSPSLTDSLTRNCPVSVTVFHQQEESALN